MTKKAILLLMAALLTLAAMAVPSLAGAVQDDHSNLFVAIYPQTNLICMNERYILRFCNVCSVFVDANTYPPLGHKWGDWKETTKPTCQADGVMTRTCTGYNCTAAETKTIDKLGGACQWVQDIMVTFPATCTERAYQMKKCSVCGTTEKQPLAGAANDPLGHDFKPVEKTAATDTAKGYQSQACKRCPEVEKKNEHSAAQCGADNPAASTDPALWKWINDVTVAPTCTTEGSEKKDCNVCGRKQTKVIPKAHTWNTGDNSAHQCNICNALELHNFVKEDGMDHKCSICAKTLAHTWVKDDATNHKCSVCNAKEKHEGSWVLDDSINHKCSICNQKEAHKWISFMITDLKYVTHHMCSVCTQEEAHKWSKNDPNNHECTVTTCAVEESHNYAINTPVLGRQTCLICQREEAM